MPSDSRADRLRYWRVGATAVVAAVVACGGGKEAPVRVTVPTGATMRTAAESLKVAEQLDCRRLNVHGTGLDAHGLPVVAT